MSEKKVVKPEYLGEFNPDFLTLSAGKLVKTATDNFKGPLSPKLTEGFSNPKAQTDELVLWATNDGDFYRRVATPIIKMLAKKAVKGDYDKNKALKVWGNAANTAADMYAKEFGSAGAKGKDMFPVNVRKLATAEFEDYYNEEIFDGVDA